MGVVVEKEALVNKKFDAIELEYNRLSKLASKAINKPHVITTNHACQRRLVRAGRK
jgi:hypothetical protein